MAKRNQPRRSASIVHTHGKRSLLIETDCCNIPMDGSRTGLTIWTTGGPPPISWRPLSFVAGFADHLIELADPTLGGLPRHSKIKRPRRSRTGAVCPLSVGGRKGASNLE